jgi:hypothetical protein
MIGSNCGNWLSHISNDVFCKHGLVAADEAIGWLAGNIVCGDDALNAR